MSSKLIQTITSTSGRITTPRLAAADDRIVLSLATPSDREEIYRLRHNIYAQELRQHPANTAGRLTDSLDEHNLYLVARCGGMLAGFVSLTPPTAPSFSIDKYVSRTALPFAVDHDLYEVRLLTVLRPYRGQNLATLLMYAAFRWVESHGGLHIAAIGRREVLDLYLKAGLRPIGLSAQSGAVTYDFLHVTISELRARTDDYAELLARLAQREPQVQLAA